MRVIDALLTAEQKKDGYTPKYKIVLSKTGETSVTIEEDKIIKLDSIEQPWSQKLEVTLDNHDNAYSVIDYKGWTLTPYFGALCNGTAYYSAAAPLLITFDDIPSTMSGINKILNAKGIFDQMADDLANDSYFPADTNTDTIKTILTAIAGATMTCFNDCPAISIVFDSEDSIIDTYQPKSSFRVYRNNSRLAVFKRLLERTGCMARPRADGAIHIFTPTTSGTSYDMEFVTDNASYQNIPVMDKRTNIVIPNYIIVQSQDDDEEKLSGTVTFATGSANITGVDTNFVTDLTVGGFIRKSIGTAWYTVLTITDATHVILTTTVSAGDNGADVADSTLSRLSTDPFYSGSATMGYAANAVKKRRYYYKLTSSAQGQAIAEAILLQRQMEAQTGFYLGNMVTNLEVFDYIKLTDARTGIELTGNIGYIHREINAPEGKYTITFNFGGWFNANKMLNELEIYNTREWDYETLSIKKLRVEDLSIYWIDPAGNIDLSKIGDTLDNLPDGSVYARVKSTHISAGSILLNDTIIYAAGYDPSTKNRTFHSQPTTPYDLGDMWYEAGVAKRCTTARATGAYVAGDWTALTMDEIANGSVYTKLLATDISAGHIKLTSSCTYAGQWYSASGVIIDADNGILIYGTNKALVTRASVGGTDQCYVGSDGAIYAGAGKVKLNADGLAILSTTGSESVIVQYYFDSTLIGYNYIGSAGWGIGASANKNLVLSISAGSGQFIFNLTENQIITPVTNGYGYLGTNSMYWKEVNAGKFTAITSGFYCKALAGNPDAYTGYAGIFSKDNPAELYALDGSANATKISPHNAKGEWEFFSQNLNTGKTVKVNMEKLVSAVERLAGIKLMEVSEGN